MENSNKGMLLDDRMKLYEKEIKLPINIPVILRVDGRAFHTFTRGMKKPFDEDFISMMNEIGVSLCNDIQNCRMAFLQSDEISFLLYNKIYSSTWFDNSIQKMASIAASRASSVATSWINKNMPNRRAPISFDARVNIYPLKDVVNYFIWRQQDWERNSVQMVARSYYSQKQVHGKVQSEMQEMIFQKGDNWNDYPTYLKRGRCIVKTKQNTYTKNKHFEGVVERSKWVIDNEIPILKDERDYILSKLEDEFVIKILK